MIRELGTFDDPPFREFWLYREQYLHLAFSGASWPDLKLAADQFLDALGRLHRAGLSA